MFFRLSETGGGAGGAPRSGRPSRSEAMPSIARDSERLAAVRARPRGSGAGLFRRHAARMGPHPRAACGRRCGRGGDPAAIGRSAVRLAARSRHRHRPHARTVRAADRSRPRPRSLARHAVGGARASRPRRPRQCRCAWATSTICRCRRTPSTSSPSTRCCTISTTARARCARRRACCAPGGRLLIVDFAPARSRVPAGAARPSPPRLRAGGRAQWIEAAGPRRRSAQRRLRPSRAPTARSPCRSGSARDRASRSPTPAGARWRDESAIRRSRVRGERAVASTFRSSSSRRRPRRWRRRCGARSTRLAPLSPQFVSVTYGAGGSTRERTHATVKRILDETALRRRRI